MATLEHELLRQMQTDDECLQCGGRGFPACSPACQAALQALERDGRDEWGLPWHW